MVASVGPRGARKRCERWELVQGSFVGSRARAHDSASSRMTEWARDNIFGEFSDIDADVLGVKRGGQECPPYDSQASLLLGCRTGASGLRVCWLGNDALWNLGLLIHVTIPVIGHSCLSYGAAMI